MSKPKQTKAYKEAVKKMAETVHRLNSGVWVGAGSGPTVMPTPTNSTQAAPLPKK